MHQSKELLGCLLGMALCAGASAQIYESRDAQGNTVFSDKPSHGAEAVDLPSTNSADPVEVRPRPEPHTAVDTSPQRSSRPDNDDTQEHGYQHDHDDDFYYYGGTYNDNNDDADTRSERREQRQNDRQSRDRPSRPGSDRPSNDRPSVDHHGGSSRPGSGMRGR
jgi:hypothetical protein